MYIASALPPHSLGRDPVEGACWNRAIINDQSLLDRVQTPNRPNRTVTTEGSDEQYQERTLAEEIIERGEKCSLSLRLFTL